jgi:hypothetical protein
MASPHLADQLGPDPRLAEARALLEQAERTTDAAEIARLVARALSLLAAVRGGSAMHCGDCGTAYRPTDAHVCLGQRRPY